MAARTHLDAILGGHLLQLSGVVVLAHAAQAGGGARHLRQEPGGWRQGGWAVSRGIVLILIFGHLRGMHA